MKKLLITIVLVASAFFVAAPLCAQLTFIENKGQWDNSVKFKINMQAGAVFLEKNGFTVVVHNPQDLQRFSEQVHGHVHEVPKETKGGIKEEPVKIGEAIRVR